MAEHTDVNTVYKTRPTVPRSWSPDREEDVHHEQSQEAPTVIVVEDDNVLERPSLAEEAPELTHHSQKSPRPPTSEGVYSDRTGSTPASTISKASGPYPAATGHLTAAPMEHRQHRSSGVHEQQRIGRPVSMEHIPRQEEHRPVKSYASSGEVHEGDRGRKTKKGIFKKLKFWKKRTKSDVSTDSRGTDSPSPQPQRASDKATGKHGPDPNRHIERHQSGRPEAVTSLSHKRPPSETGSRGSSSKHRTPSPRHRGGATELASIESPSTVRSQKRRIHKSGSGGASLGKAPSSTGSGHSGTGRRTPSRPKTDPTLDDDERVSLNASMHTTESKGEKTDEKARGASRGKPIKSATGKVHPTSGEHRMRHEGTETSPLVASTGSKFRYRDEKGLRGWWARFNDPMPKRRRSWAVAFLALLGCFIVGALYSSSVNLYQTNDANSIIGKSANSSLESEQNSSSIAKGGAWKDKGQKEEPPGGKDKGKGKEPGGGKGKDKPDESGGGGKGKDDGAQKGKSDKTEGKPKNKGDADQPEKGGGRPQKGEQGGDGGDRGEAGFFIADEESQHPGGEPAHERSKPAWNPADATPAIASPTSGTSAPNPGVPESESEKNKTAKGTQKDEKKSTPEQEPKDNQDEKRRGSKDSRKDNGKNDDRKEQAEFIRNGPEGEKDTFLNQTGPGDEKGDWKKNDKNQKEEGPPDASNSTAGNPKEKDYWKGKPKKDKKDQWREDEEYLGKNDDYDPEPGGKPWRGKETRDKKKPRDSDREEQAEFILNGPEGEKVSNQTGPDDQKEGEGKSDNKQKAEAPKVEDYWNAAPKSKGRKDRRREQEEYPGGKDKGDSDWSRREKDGPMFDPDRQKQGYFVRSEDEKGKPEDTDQNGFDEKQGWRKNQTADDQPSRSSIARSNGTEDRGKDEEYWKEKKRKGQEKGDKDREEGKDEGKPRKEGRKDEKPNDEEDKGDNGWFRQEKDKGGKREEEFFIRTGSLAETSNDSAHHFNGGENYLKGYKEKGQEEGKERLENGKEEKKPSKEEEDEKLREDLRKDLEEVNQWNGTEDRGKDDEYWKEKQRKGQEKDEKERPRGKDTDWEKADRAGGQGGRPDFDPYEEDKPKDRNKGDRQEQADFIVSAGNQAQSNQTDGDQQEEESKPAPEGSGYPRGKGKDYWKEKATKEGGGPGKDEERNWRGEHESNNDDQKDRDEREGRMPYVGIVRKHETDPRDEQEQNSKGPPKEKKEESSFLAREESSDRQSNGKNDKGSSDPRGDKKSDGRQKEEKPRSQDPRDEKPGDKRQPESDNIRRPGKSRKTKPQRERIPKKKCNESSCEEEQTNPIVLNEMQWGFIEHLPAAVVFVLAPIVGLLCPFAPRLFLLVGLLCLGGSYVGYGFIHMIASNTGYFNAALTLRVFQGFGTASFLVAMFAMLAFECTGNMAMVTSVAVGALFAGFTVGPAIFYGFLQVSTNYDIGVWILGGIAIILSFICCPCVKVINGQVAEKWLGKSPSMFSSIFLWFLSLSTIATSMSVAFYACRLFRTLFEVSNSPLFISLVMVGFVLIFLIVLFIFGALMIVRTYAAWTYSIVGLGLTTVGYFIAGPCPIFEIKAYEWSTGVSAGILAIGFGMTLATLYSGMVDAANKVGKPDNLRLNSHVAGVFIGATFVGVFLASIINEYTITNIGWPWTTTILACVNLFMVLVGCVYKGWKTFCRGKNKNNFNDDYARGAVVPPLMASSYGSMDSRQAKQII